MTATERHLGAGGGRSLNKILVFVNSLAGLGASPQTPANRKSGRTPAGRVVIHAPVG